MTSDIHAGQLLTGAIAMISEGEVLTVAWGGGVNSTALLLGLLEHGIRPDCILFADTGNRDAEKPETYAYWDMLSPWLEARGFPPITRVHNDGMYESLEDNCLKKQMLPSLAYGFKSCSEKYKKRPQLKYLKAQYGDLSRVVQAIGIHADEARRAKPFASPRSVYPLIEWGWGQEECQQAIRRHGLALPPKSSCFFCPASTLPEIRWLKEHHPELLERALQMEANADLVTVKGLGRRFSWRAFVANELPMAPPEIEAPCGCYDGE